MAIAKLNYNSPESISSILVENNSRVENIKNQILVEKDYEKKSIFRKEMLKIQKQSKNIIKNTRNKIGVIKTDVEFLGESIASANKYNAKANKMFDRTNEKYSSYDAGLEDTKKRILDYKSNGEQKKSDQTISKNALNLEKQIDKQQLIQKKLNGVSEKLTLNVNFAKDEVDFYKVETIEAFEKDFKTFIENAKQNGNNEEVDKLNLEYSKIKKSISKTFEGLESNYNEAVIKDGEVKQKLANVDLKINEIKQTLKDSESSVEVSTSRIQQFKKDITFLREAEVVKLEVKELLKIKDKSEKKLNIQIKKNEDINIKLENYSKAINVQLEEITPINSSVTKAFNSIEKMLLKDWFFIIIVAILGGGVVLSTWMFVEYGVGALNEIFVVVMLSDGLNSGDYSAAMGFATGFLIARVLEGPLVGILDVGGSILSGLGIGIPAVFLSSTKLAFVMHNPILALILGIVGGLIIGIVIMVIRALKPKGEVNLGTDIMIGAGNATGKFLGPLVIFSAAMFNPIVGLGAGLGGAAFMWIKKPIVGGAIIGAMLFGIIPAFL